MIVFIINVQSEEMDADKRTLKLMDKCNLIVAKLQVAWPQYDLDGYRNVWILKPGAKSRGRGL